MTEPWNVCRSSCNGSCLLIGHARHSEPRVQFSECISKPIGILIAQFGKAVKIFGGPLGTVDLCADATNDQVIDTMSIEDVEKSREVDRSPAVAALLGGQGTDVNEVIAQGHLCFPRHGYAASIGLA